VRDRGKPFFDRVSIFCNAHLPCQIVSEVVDLSTYLETTASSHGLWRSSDCVPVRLAECAKVCEGSQARNRRAAGVAVVVVVDGRDVVWECCSVVGPTGFVFAP
jgi:hypothetical protein